MLTAEQILPFLSSDDAIVRDHAVRYFDDFAGEHSPVTADICWAAINRIGLNRDVNNLIRLLPQTRQSDASTGVLLGALDINDDESARGALFAALNNIDFEQLKLHREPILGLRKLPNGVRFNLLDRLELERTPAEMIWQRLEEHGTSSDDLYWNQVAHLTTARFLEAICRHREFATERATAIVNNPVLKGSALEIFAIDLLGRLRHRPAMEILLNRLADSDPDDDALHEVLQENLPRVGGVDLIAPLEEMYLKLRWESQIYAGGALARLRHPDAEAALFRLYQDPRSEISRDELANDLFDLCTTVALPELMRKVVNGEFDRQVFELDQDLVACSLMSDFDFPELPAMREEVVARDDRFRRELASGEFHHSLIDELDDDLSEEDFDDDEYDDNEMDSFYPEVPAELSDRVPAPPRMIVNREPKIGRNDPCPCGSGKKYKKCCLNKNS